MPIAGLFRRRRHDVEVVQPMKARPKVVWHRFMTVGWLDGEARWGPEGDFILWDGTRIKVRYWDPPHGLGFWWIPQVGDRTKVDVHLALQPNGHTNARIRHKGITDDEASRRFKTRWAKVLRGLAQTV